MTAFDRRADFLPTEHTLSSHSDTRLLSKTSSNNRSSGGSGGTYPRCCCRCSCNSPQAHPPPPKSDSRSTESNHCSPPEAKPSLVSQHRDALSVASVCKTSRTRKIHDNKQRTNISVITTSSNSHSSTSIWPVKRSRSPGQVHQSSDSVLTHELREGRAPRSRGQKQLKVNRLLLLLLVFVVYVSLGAVVFNALEAGAEQERKDELDDFVWEFLEKNPCVNRSDLYYLLKKAVVDSEIVNYVVDNKTHLDRWDFSGSFGFVVSVVTTIGFGNMSPFTLEGKVVCVLYALFGIPLTLLVLAGLGENMALCVSRVQRCQNPVCHQTPRVNRILNMFFISSLGVLLIFVAPAAMFTYVEQWHFMESLYFCFTTLSTIGFGDYVIGIHETRLTNMYTHEFYEVVAYVWILVGLAYLSLVYRYITDTMVAKAQEVGRSTIRKLGPEISRTLRRNGSQVSLSATRSRSSSSSSSQAVYHWVDPIRAEDTEVICEIQGAAPTDNRG